MCFVVMATGFKISRFKKTKESFLVKTITSYIYRSVKLLAVDRRAGYRIVTHVHKEIKISEMGKSRKGTLRHGLIVRSCSLSNINSMFQFDKVTYELRTTSARNAPHMQSCAQEKEEFLSWAVKGLSVFCAITPNVNLLEIAKLWAHPSRALIVHQNCSTGQASGKSANALLAASSMRFAML